MKLHHRPLAAALMAASILVSGLGSGAAEAQQSSVTKPLSAVTFEGAPLSQTDGDVSAPALADLAPDATLDLLVRLDAPSLYQVLDQVETNTAALQDASVPMSLDAISSIHNTLKQGQEPVIQAIQAAGGQLVERLQTTSNALHVRIRRDRLATLAAIPGIRSMGRMPTFQLTLGDARPHIGATKVAEELGFTGKGVTIAVIDTGIDYMHAALGGHGDKAKRDADDDTVIEAGTFPTAKVVGGWDFVGFLYDANNAANATPKPDMDPIDDGGHGSHVAGISASQGGGKVDKGMAPDAKLVSLKVFGAGGSTNITAGAMEWVANHNLYLGQASDKVPGTRPATKIDVINMSLGAGFGGGTKDYEEVVESLIEHEVTVVASAGNSGPTPFIVGSPSATEKVLSVANSVAPGESALALKVNWTADDGAKEELHEALEGAEWMASLASTGVRTGELAWYGLACNDDMGNPTAPVQDVTEKIALIERGTCPFYDKLVNAAKMGATAAVVFSDARPKTAMGCAAPSPCDTKVEIPGVMIDNEPGVALKDLLVGGTVVTATLDPASKIEQIWLTDTMDDSSSRGPGRFYAHIKPQITAPGHNIFSVANGSGTEGVSFSGTSMSGPAVAGVTALLWERNNTQNLGLSADDIAALAMNYADPVIHRSRNDTGPLEGVMRQGAGLTQAYKSAVAHTLVRSERGLAELSFGVTHAAGEPTTKTINLTVRNLSDKAASYKLDYAFAFPEQDADSGVTLSFEPDMLAVEGGKSAQVAVTLTADPAGMTEYDVYGAAPIMPEDRFQEQEVDGYVHLTEVDAAGMAVDKGDVVGVPFQTLPMRSSCTVPDSMDAVYLGQEKDQTLPLSWSNECNNIGLAETFWALGQDDEESAAGDFPATLDVAAVGVRYGDRVFADSSASPVLQFGVATFQSSTLVIDSRVSVFLDSDKDGTFDFVVFRLGQGVNALNVFAPAMTGDDGYPAPIADQAQWLVFNDVAFQSVNYNVQDLFASLTLPLELFGADVTFDGTLSFDFAVQATDDMGDFTPEGQPSPVGDWAPSDVKDGGRYHFDQARLDCVKLMTDDSNWMDIDAMADLEENTGNADAELSWICEPVATDAEPMDLGILTHYINNMPGMDWGLRDIILGREPNPILYLPLVVPNHDLTTPYVEPTATP